jgi:methyl-accepting chemotaxis protein
MRESAVAFAVAVEQQGAATAEIARTVDGLVVTTGRVSGAVATLETAARGADAGSRDVAGRADELTAEAEGSRGR